MINFNFENEMCMVIKHLNILNYNNEQYYYSSL